MSLAIQTPSRPYTASLRQHVDALFRMGRNSHEIAYLIYGFFPDLSVNDIEPHVVRILNSIREDKRKGRGE